MDLLFAESNISGYGTEQHYAALAIAMMRRGHRVRCLISAGTVLEGVLRDAEVPVIVTRYVRGGSFNVRRAQLLFRIVSSDRPDWLVTNDARFYWPMMLTSWRTGIPTALFRHWPFMSRSLLTRRLLPQLADRFVLVSRFQREAFEQDGVNVSPMQLLYNPIDTQRLRPSPEARSRMRATLGVSDAGLLIGFVGRTVIEKGIFTLLDAFDHLASGEPDARMLWVGSGRDLPELRAKVQQSTHPGRHLFHAWTDDVLGIYNALDLLIVPSINGEPFGRVSVEAQSCGTPVICSDAGGLPETFLPGSTGLQVRRGDVKQLTDAILSLSRDPARRERMAIAAREHACASFSFDRIAQSFEALLADKHYMPPHPGGNRAAPQAELPLRQSA